MKKPILFIGLLISAISLYAQNNDDTEFRKRNGFLLLLNINNGVTSNFKSTLPDLYSVGISLQPQWVIVENKLRIGANGAMVYHNKRTDGLVGPMLAFKLSTMNAGKFGGLANTQLQAMAHWGTHKQSTVGLGFALELLQKIQLAMSLQRDYHFDYWWIQSHIGIKLNKHKRKRSDFE